MAKVESFQLDHDAVRAPYVRLAGSEQHASGARVSKFNLRFVQPNHDAIPTSAMHTLEHLLAINLRDYIPSVIDVSPMGCRTGFYLIVWDAPSIATVAEALQKVLQIVLDTETIPAATAKECGNFRDHSLFSAKIYAKQVLDQQISLDPFDRSELL